jgi:DNA polymerase-1
VLPAVFYNTLVRDEGSFAEMMAELGQHQRIAYDTETSGLFPHLGARICGHAFGVDVGTEIRTWYVPVRHHAGSPQLAHDFVAPVIGRLFADRKRTVVGHHLKFDAKMLRADGQEIACGWDDTILKATANDENETSFALKKLVAKYVLAEAEREQAVLDRWMRLDARNLGIPYKRRSNDSNTYQGRYGYSRTPIPLCGVYACHDVAYTLLLDKFLTPRIKDYEKVYRREIAVARILLDLEWYGMLANVEEIRRSDIMMRREVAHWEQQITELVGPMPSFDDEGVRELLYQRLGMRVPKETKGGAGRAATSSVDKEARLLLAKAYPEHAPALKALDKLKTAQKVGSTYAGSWLAYVSPEGRIHSSYNQMEQRDEGGAPITGRLSSADPNTQNIAKKPLHLFDCGCKECHDNGLASIVSIRRYYLVPSGFVRVYFDLNQIELRVLTWFSQDPVLLECYANDLDIHQITADEVTGGDRFIAKQVNFGNSYGMTKIGLARRLPYYAEDPERALVDAEQYLRRFFEKYAGIPAFRKKFAKKMRDNGGIFVNPFGRPRRIPEVLAKDDKIRARGERMMMSSIISGTAADMLKEILIRSDAVLREHYASVPSGARGRAVQTIHDEIAFDLPIAGCGEVIEKLARCFTTWPQFEKRGVPIRVNCELSTSTWENKRPIKIVPGGFAWAA